MVFCRPLHWIPASDSRLFYWKSNYSRYGRALTGWHIFSPANWTAVADKLMTKEDITRLGVMYSSCLIFAIWAFNLWSCQCVVGGRNIGSLFIIDGSLFIIWYSFSMVLAVIFQWTFSYFEIALYLVSVLLETQKRKWARPDSTLAYIEYHWMVLYEEDFSLARVVL